MRIGPVAHGHTVRAARAGPGTGAPTGTGRTGAPGPWKGVTGVRPGDRAHGVDGEE
ncbi:hypothetical protein GCM10027160_02080 [Streptomyces calidiresistens]